MNIGPTLVRYEDGIVCNGGGSFQLKLVCECVQFEQHAQIDTDKTEPLHIVECVKRKQCCLNGATTGRDKNIAYQSSVLMTLEFDLSY